jgi:hypothetical protein
MRIERRRAMTIRRGKHAGRAPPADKRWETKAKTAMIHALEAESSFFPLGGSGGTRAIGMTL